MSGTDTQMTARSVSSPTTMLVATVFLGLAATPSWAALKIGDTAPDFELDSLGGGKVRLSDLSREGSVVVVVLRGYPGYQCPICSAQVTELIGKADEFRAANARVLLVYPGPSEGLKSHAAEFVVGKTVPKKFDLILDPDFAFTESYGLRWDAPNETVYPSTFVVDRNRIVRFAKISRTHGGRAKVGEILEAIGD
jgi:thioredoxin-dependent peroxiredoxin